MKALVTGASSGIGLDMAKYLDNLGYELILVSRSEDKLKELFKDFKSVKCYGFDLSKEKDVYKLYDTVKSEDVDLVVNNAGFGLFGFFNETSLDKELEMIDLNIKSVHIFTKLFVKDMINKNKGYVLNVASSAGFLSGPYLSTYYATKNYVLKLTMAINHELKEMGSNVHVCALCPGPVDTNFNNVAGGSFKAKGLTSEYVAKYGIDKCLKKKMIIIPSLKMKIAIFLSRFVPYRLLLKIVYFIQKSKENM